jgi:sulfatase modifying factor 1
MPELAPPPAPWATATGADSFGPWADLTVGPATQRFRWCPPGRFWMGSPDGEAGRYADEGPRHEVLLTRGRWMADSPVTQALYVAVMGHNPSHFADADPPGRPVEMLSWEGAVAFCAALEDRLRAVGLADDGLVFRLPTEAEWEQACRAGTSGATYAGDLLLPGQRSAPGLDPIAWYEGNSGLGHGPTGGGASGGWAELQPPHRGAGTRRVRQKRPNPWGLSDTLGLVWEWCADALRPGAGYPVDAAGGPRVDPLGREGRDRACRGGGWSDRAQTLRAAHRGDGGPGLRTHALGLRLCRGAPLPPLDPPDDGAPAR